MKQPTFLFIALLLFSFPFLSGGVELSIESQFTISMLLVFTIGIAHGSVDNLLYLKKSKMKPVRFYLIYLILVGIYAATWFIFPLFALTLFLLISAYHFGQSQLTDCFKESKFSHKLLYALWGIALISALINLKQEEVIAMFNPHHDLRVVTTLVGSSYVNAIHIGSSIFVAILMLYFVATNKLRSDRLLFEIFILIAINVSFAVLPV
ncbi:MAG: Brp/Blh family beta-carotene 15,15'-dioxygenase, partial [Spirosomaceae bacterium]|nr:Brp/Blh family beta-carotene 15,15'-dioxygenase [Spirosomataceae bacterium]